MPSDHAVTEFPLASDDPFGLVDLVTLSEDERGTLTTLVEVGPREPVRDPLAPQRVVGRQRDGTLILAEVAGGTAVRIGQPVTFRTAHTLATAVLCDNARARTDPNALTALAIAYMAALAAAERRRLLLSHRTALPASRAVERS